VSRSSEPPDEVIHAIEAEITARRISRRGAARSYDHLVYETEGERQGALIGYWHTDDDRKVEHPSLRAWAKATADALERPR
jgi:regulator of protease activity HflC (stomatin/prohibitin superfamily)